MSLNSPSIEDLMFSWGVIRETDTHLSEGMWGCHGVCRCMGLRRGGLLPISPSTQWWPGQHDLRGTKANIFFFITLLLFKYSWLHFRPTTPHPTPAKSTSLPCFHPPPWFCPHVLYSSSWKPFSPLSPPTSQTNKDIHLWLINMNRVSFPPTELFSKNLHCELRLAWPWLAPWLFIYQWGWWGPVSDREKMKPRELNLMFERQNLYTRILV